MKITFPNNMMDRIFYSMRLEFCHKIKIYLSNFKFEKKKKKNRESHLSYAISDVKVGKQTLITPPTKPVKIRETIK